MSDSARVGSTLGPYRLTRLIGRGGMGEVYEAEDTVKGRVVAVKLLPETLSHDPVFRERLQREARAAGRLQEPHVVPIHDFGEIDGHLFVDMRLIDGTDLATVLTGVGVMEPGRAVSLIGQVAAALDAAHAAGIAHRDVKPENILVTSGDFAYLVDFGIASAATDRTLTEKGSTIGTYAYMAPERFGGKPVTPSVDVYALACVLYQCLTGARPYPADNVSTLIAAHLMETPPKPSHVRPGIPASLDAVIAKGMAKSADERYPTAGALARAAEDALSGARPPADTVAHHALPTVPAAPVPELAAPARPRGRRALLIGGAFAVVAVVVAVGVIAWTVVPSAGDMRSASTTVTVTRAPDDAGGVPATAAGVLTPGNANCWPWSRMQRHARRTRTGTTPSPRWTANRPRAETATNAVSMPSTATATSWRTISPPCSPRIN